MLGRFSREMAGVWSGRIPVLCGHALPGYGTVQPGEIMQGGMALELPCPGCLDPLPGSMLGAGSSCLAINTSKTLSGLGPSRLLADKAQPSPWT